MNAQDKDSCLQDWVESQELAEAMVPLIGKLYRDRGIVLLIYGRSLINASPIELLKTHRYVRQFENVELSIQDSFKMLEALISADLAPARIDLGKLAIRYNNEGNGASLSDYLKKELSALSDAQGQILEEPQDIVLYGFGRIGRLLARLLIERTGGGNKMRLRAIVLRNSGAKDDLAKRASLLRRDSVHGTFDGTIRIDTDNNTITANGNCIQVIYASAPDEIDYTQYGINNALVVDNTGVWRDEAGLGRHLKAKGVSKALLTAPGKGDIKNVVFGVNDGDIESSDTILSAASCTTNAIAPVLKAVNDEYGIVNGHVETVHSYTNDQNLIDNFHKGERRGRAAPLNMVLTETGAAKAVSKALPELEGKLTGNAIRVPTPNVSMAIMNLNLSKETTKDALNDYLRDIALHSSMQEQIDFTRSTELVSTDIVGSRHAGVVDSQATIADGNRCVLYVWYDNEFGYSCQVIKVMQKMVGIEYLSLPVKSA